MAVGTTTSVKHNPKEDLAEGVARGHPDESHGQHESADDKEASSIVGSGEHNKHKSGHDQSHESCKNCGSLADKCSCKDCECQVCSSKTASEDTKVIEPPIKSATSSAVVCGGGCISAAQRAAAGGCPACECPAGACTKCGCPICGAHQNASDSTACCGGSEAAARATAGNCPACGCPAGNCPCSGCKCPVCDDK